MDLPVGNSTADHPSSLGERGGSQLASTPDAAWSGSCGMCAWCADGEVHRAALPAARACQHPGPAACTHKAWSCAADSCVERLQVGAAVLGVAVKPTIKEADQQGQVIKTLQRASLWEVQTPQVCLLVANVQATASQPCLVGVRKFVFSSLLVQLRGCRLCGSSLAASICVGDLMWPCTCTRWIMTVTLLSRRSRCSGLLV